MANPRQRRKAKSGTAKVSMSKASRKNKFNKVVLQRAPAVLSKSYDKSKTVRQNYARLGLLSSLDPRQSGGLEPIEKLPYAVTAKRDVTLSDLDDDDENDSESSSSDEDDDDDDDVDQQLMASTSATQEQPRKLVKGEGRIVRDSNGKVVKIVLGGEDEDEMEEDVDRIERSEGDHDEDEDEEDEAQVKPWGEPMKNWSTDRSSTHDTTKQTRQGIPIGARGTVVVAKTQVVQELEELSSKQQPVVRHTSALEGDWLLSLVDKYGDDVDKMARDRKVNPWQKTPGEIKRAIAKAGGFSKLKAKLARKETRS